MRHYYGANIDGYKMVLISNYTSDDVLNFVQTTQLKRSEKQRLNVRKQLEHFHINNVKSKAQNGCSNSSNHEHKNNDDQDEDAEMKENVDGYDGGHNKMEKIEDALRRLCGGDWKFYFKRFQDEEVYDDGLFDLSEEDLAKLLPKIGPRSRVRNWIKQMKQNQK